MTTIDTSPTVPDSRLSIRLSSVRDIPMMREVLSEAKAKMRESGNMSQWTGDYPSDEMLADDIRRGVSYVVECRGAIVATFVLAVCADPTYATIHEGGWVDDMRPYGTIHRIGSRKGYHGILEAVLRFAGGIIDNVRIDTHRDNKPMRHLLEKLGFTYCGIIYLLNGDERLAYQKIQIS
ncbi:MAG: GNAT family N-acetyltransferase [Bacteroidaceae bacterium]|nr:GNAT family N-acetyltransferase [Bacteroidaceae bacterium]